MLVRLAKTKRLKAGWLLAITYMLCVLAPAASFALPGEHTVAPCLSDDSHVPGMAHVHNGAFTQHSYQGEHLHEHSAAHLHSSSSVDQHDSSIAPNDEHAPAKDSHSPDGQCCGLMCLTALPAALVNFAEPSVVTSLCASEVYRPVADSGPVRHYRPPIS